MKSIIQDARSRPELFNWEGKIRRRVLARLLARQGWEIPEDLFSFWAETGGGEIFESETILSPCGGEHFGDNLLGYNKELRARGLPAGYVVFHTGMTLSAVRIAGGLFVELDPVSFREKESFPSLESWYLCLIRAEYQERYRL